LAPRAKTENIIKIIAIISIIAVLSIDVVCCYTRSGMVCLSVCLSVTVVRPAKTAEPMEMPFELWTRVGPRNNVLLRVHIPTGRGNFEGKGRPIVKYIGNVCRELGKNG